MKTISQFIIVIVILTTLLPAVGFGQEEAALHQGLGLSAGIVGGTGFSYRYMPEKGLGFHSSVILWKVHDNSYFHIALEPLFILKNSGQTAMYLVGGWALVETEENSDGAVGFGMGFAWRRFAWWPQEQVWTSFDLVMTSFRGDIFPYPQAALHYLIW